MKIIDAARKRPALTPLQILVHIGAWIPLIVLILDYQTNNLSVNPYQAAERRTGDIALILLVLSLACTPLNALFRAPVLIKLRRPLGLYAYMYAAIHLFIFAGLDYGFSLEMILLDVGDKRYIIVGLIAFILLSLLAATSFNWWKKRLGKGWKRLHQVVYAINLLVVLHAGWAAKGDFFRLQGEILKPLVALLVITPLLIMRIPAVRRRIAGQLQIPRRSTRKKEIIEGPRSNPIE